MTMLRAYQTGNSTTGSTATILLPSNFVSLRASGGHLHSMLCDRAFSYQPAFILRRWQAAQELESDQPKENQPKDDRLTFSIPNWKLMEEVLHCSSQ